MTYTNVFRVLEGDPDAVREYEDFAPRFRLMQDLAKILSARRLKRVAIDLDLPEAEILLDEQGRMTGVKPSERNIAHRIIEEFMLAANEAVAGELERLERPSLHRIHEPPSAKSLTDFETVARQFGRSLGVEITTKSFNRARRGRDGTKKTRQVQVAKETSVSSRDLQKFVEQLRGAPEARVLGSRLLRAMKQARYSEESKGHFALAATDYTHFTSPIRRYPDLVVHRVLGAQLDRDAQGPYCVETLAEIADQSSINERRAQAAERELLDWKKAKYIESRIGDEFHALIVSVDEFGMWIELEELFVDGYVPLESFEGERFSYREKSRALVGARSKKQYSIGDRVKVRAVRVAFDRLRAEFACVVGD
jgi:ribonuclease R